jgi:flagellar motility protein MotE (MotC chaperone)
MQSKQLLGGEIMKRELLYCILAFALAAVAGCRTTAPDPALTAHEERALSALTSAVDDQRTKVADADKHLAKLQDTGAEQARVQRATSDLEHQRRILKALEDRWDQERDKMINRR